MAFSLISLKGNIVGQALECNEIFMILYPLVKVNGKISPVLNEALCYEGFMEGGGIAPFILYSTRRM
jgi:hypothetical protein